MRCTHTKKDLEYVLFVMLQAYIKKTPTQQAPPEDIWPLDFKLMFRDTPSKNLLGPSDEILLIIHYHEKLPDERGITYIMLAL